MIKVLEGDVLQSQSQTLVNTVNCVGVMGKGIALRFKERFPDMFKDYLARCHRGEVTLGRPYLYKSATHPWVLNFPTKHHWRSVSRIDDIDLGLKYLSEHYREWGITSLSVPPLGCGQGRLHWADVREVLYRHLSRLDIPVQIYAPHGTAREELLPRPLAQKGASLKAGIRISEAEEIKPAWVALVEVLSRVLENRYHWPVGRTMFQKIAYVVTEEGLPTGLHFQKASFGPFSPEFKGLLTALVNKGLINEAPLGPMLSVTVGPAFEDALETHIRQLERWRQKIAKIADLFLRIRGTRQSEVVASVLFVARGLTKAKGTEPSEAEVLTEVMAWKQRRRPPLDEPEVGSIIRSLAALGWLAVTPSADLPMPEEALAGA